ncbi:MAG TPA: hypothetical protein ENI45_01485, partial [Thermoplasmatales archaeon]|nr:hypothetical protein [Thermoplasmatales archaeon]
SPAVADGKVYVGSNKMLCLDACTGEEIWSYQADDDYFGYSSPAIANGRLYIGCYDWRLYCFADPLLNISKVSGGIGKVCVELMNPGDNPARNISWNITIKGGVYGIINVTTMGSLASLEPGETMVVSTNQTIFGLGLINIMVTAVAENTKPVYKEKKGLVFGPFVFTLPW